MDIQNKDHSSSEVHDQLAGSKEYAVKIEPDVESDCAYRGRTPCVYALGGRR